MLFARRGLSDSPGTGCKCQQDFRRGGYPSDPERRTGGRGGEKVNSVCTRVRKILAISRMGFVSARLGELDANKATIPRPFLLPNLHPPLREKIQRSRLETPNKGMRTKPHQSISSGIGAIGGGGKQREGVCVPGRRGREEGDATMDPYLADVNSLTTHAHVPIH